MVQVQTRISICRDIKDNRGLEVAQSGKAQVIVTGDLDVLVLNPFGDVAILRPQSLYGCIARMNWRDKASII
ncbi:MAG: hypothetical protein OHK0052_16140 [Anaerolineales bacterium]